MSGEKSVSTQSENSSPSVRTEESHPYAPLRRNYLLARYGGPVIIGGIRTFDLGGGDSNRLPDPTLTDRLFSFRTGIPRSHACSTYRQRGPTST